MQKKLDLRLEPRTHVSPHHAPIADMIYRVEVCPGLIVSVDPVQNQGKR